MSVNDASSNLAFGRTFKHLFCLQMTLNMKLQNRHYVPPEHKFGAHF